MITIQKIKTKPENQVDRARKYFKIISEVNNLNLTEMQINLLAFIGVFGSISRGGQKEKFCQMFKSTKNYVNNLCFMLNKRGLIRKENDRYQVIPQLKLDFSKPLILQITLDGTEGQNNTGTV